jgi:hypothetical protein
MAMELRSLHDQFVTCLAAHEEHDNFAFLDIIQGTQLSHPQFELGKGIGAQLLDRVRGCRRLVLQPSSDSCFQDSLIARG